MKLRQQQTLGPKFQYAILARNSRLRHEESFQKNSCIVIIPQPQQPNPALFREFRGYSIGLHRGRWKYFPSNGKRHGGISGYNQASYSQIASYDVRKLVHLSLGSQENFTLPAYNLKTISSRDYLVLRANRYTHACITQLTHDTSTRRRLLAWGVKACNRIMRQAELADPLPCPQQKYVTSPRYQAAGDRFCSLPERERGGRLLQPLMKSHA